MRAISSIIAAILVVSACEDLVFAATKKYGVTGRISDASGYSIMLVQENGDTHVGSLKSSGAFSIKSLSLTQLKNASLHLIDGDGRYAGPVVLATKGSQASITFSGKTPRSSTLQLGKISLNSGYATLKKNQLDKTQYSRPRVGAVDGKPIGAGEMGLVQSTTTSGLRIQDDTESNPGADEDLDGIPNAFDADDDGDLIIDATDPDSVGQDVPYTGLFFDFRRTLNANVRAGLNDTVIDSAISGENAFSLTFFISLPPNQSDIDGGHVVCDDSLTYCRPNTPLGYYGGISESTSEFRDHPWSELLTSSGYPRMERISVSGSPAIVASIQPRVGPDEFRPGDVYQVRLTEGESVRSTRSFALAPYFVSIPALKEYNAGSGSVSVDYSSLTADSGSIPGLPGNPIVLGSDGLLTLTFWRPQRLAIGSSESGYYDWGHLNYGVVIEQAQATCAGYYSSLSSELTEDSSALGEGNSPLAQNGADLTPLRDSPNDRAADASHTLSFTVNLKDCLSRAGQSPGVYSIDLQAAGESVTGGRSAATQVITVQIP